MDLYQLRTFLEAARELSFTRAAGNLFVSPPAVSISIGLLERSLKKKLFSRSNRRVRLTTDGEFLKSQVEPIFDALSKISHELEAGSGAAPSVLKIGSREMITNYLFPSVLAEFSGRHPGTRLYFHEFEPRQMAEALKKDLIDFGFFYADIPDPALESQRLGILRSHIYASREFFSRTNRPRSFRQLLGHPFIAPRYFQDDPSALSVDGFPDQRHPRNIRYGGEFLETHRRFVLEGLALAVLPDLVIREEFRRGEVVRLPGPRLLREIYFFKRRSRPLPRAVDFFCAQLRRVIRTQRGPSTLRPESWR